MAKTATATSGGATTLIPVTTKAATTASAKTQKRSYASLVPEDVGLASFDLIDRVPISDEAKTRISDQLTSLDQLKQLVDRGEADSSDYETMRKQVQDTWSDLLKGPLYVTPPTGSTMKVMPTGSQTGYAELSATGNVGQPAGVVSADQTAAAAGATAEAEPKTLDYLAETKRILAEQSEKTGALERAQQEYVTKGMETKDWTESDERQLELVRQSVAKTLQTGMASAEAKASAAGMKSSGDVIRRYQAETDNAVDTLANAEVALRKEAASRGQTARSAAYAASVDLVAAIKNNDTAMVQALLQARQQDIEADLSQQQVDLQREAQQEQIRLNRDTFTEEKRKQLVAEGFTEEQITNAETQAQWERVYQDKQLTASTDLAQQNIDLQTKVADQNYSIADREQALAEIKNNQDQSLAERTFELQKQLGLESADLERDKFDSMVQQLEREYGMEINEFALKESIEKGTLDLAILDSQRKYDLAVQSEKDQFLLSSEANQIQLQLGMSELELKAALGEGELDVQREQQILEKYMFDAGLAWDKEKFSKQQEAAKKKSSGGLLGKIIKTVVKAGVGVASAFTGGAVGTVVDIIGSALGASDVVAASDDPGPKTTSQYAEDVGESAASTGEDYLSDWWKKWGE